MEDLANGKLKIEIDLEGGWTRVQLISGDFIYGFGSSFIVYDSFTELLTALLSVSSNYSGEFLVRWNDEPEEREFVFEAEDKNLKFVAYVISYNFHNERIRKKVFSYTSSIYEIVRAFWKALRDMESKQTHEEYAAKAYHSFPKSEMLELTRKVKAMKLEQN